MIELLASGWWLPGCVPRVEILASKWFRCESKPGNGLRSNVESCRVKWMSPCCITGVANEGNVVLLYNRRAWLHTIFYQELRCYLPLVMLFNVATYVPVHSLNIRQRSIRRHYVKMSNPQPKMTRAHANLQQLATLHYPCLCVWYTPTYICLQKYIHLSVSLEYGSG